MFVQQQKLSFLNVPSKRLRRLFSSTVDVQVALPDYPAQMAAVYLAALNSNHGIQILLGFYLRDSRSSVFFVPSAGEVGADQADSFLQEGLEFAESMGFVLADNDIHQYNPEQLDSFWRSLPICRRYVPPVPKPDPAAVKNNITTEVTREKPVEVKKEKPVEVKKEKPVEVKKEKPVEVKKEKPGLATAGLQQYRKRCKESLGRFLASL